MQENQELCPPQTAKRRTWKKTIRIARGWFYITFSNCRVKKRDTCGYNTSREFAHELRDIKEKLYNKCEGVCPHCGQHHDISFMEIHHVLPWARFPELRGTKRNMMLLCHYCHKEVHINPWLNIQLMRAKAEELDIDLTERYKTGAVESEQACALNDEYQSTAPAYSYTAHPQSDGRTNIYRITEK